ncbi:hypothetical protein BU24DRAFT_417095 [Aaosphaeria arxii CBS 175.79]|uniref:Capsule polysaccharide biosynthesis protein n=1 Tax=Aaosphaeria arxii CBS 175.79 TaxID=1450172 RepID=A0A6A5Y7A7_9PLEO|nr:uncharacterized protein BU24DRAFT_417095 [Aaosphaeria arxii CBS 175.79]KAF2021442.1 hypothetical protein BU24DRAFT_417095 [Aaosphaeria arxii CBS 175.79]
MTYPEIPRTIRLPYKIEPSISLDNLPESLTAPGLPKTGGKSIFAFWNTGISSLPPYLLRNVINWHRRFSPLGWTIYVLDTVPGSALNVSNFIDTTSRSIVPEAFINNSIVGKYAAQHTSDLVRFPLLLRYGGVYLDVGVLLFGDINSIWTEQISNPESPFDFFGFTMGEAPDLQIVNFALMAGANNPLIERAHRILLKLWEGKNTTTNAHENPLVSHVPLMRVPQEVTIDDGEEGKMVIDDKVMTDYAIQIQCMGSAQRWLDEDEGWDGPKYVREKCWLLSMIDAVYVHEQATSWNGKRCWDLLNQSLPEDGATESADQALARKIVEEMVADSWALKLGHGFAAKLFGGDTLGILWRKNDGSDCKEGTYAGWLRWAELNCQQEHPMKRMIVSSYEPSMKARLADFEKK